MPDQHAEAYPLYWPPNRPRTSAYSRTNSKFETTFARARDELVRELKLLGASGVILSTNVTLRRDGLPLAGQRQPDDPGVAVYFAYQKRPLCFACDRWRKVEDNIWAVCKTIDALRGIARWGTGDMIAAAFAGFRELPPAASNGKLWSDVLGVVGQPSREAVAAAYRDQLMRRHPDRGGSAEAMAELDRARQQIPEHLRP